MFRPAVILAARDPRDADDIVDRCTQAAIAAIRPEMSELTTGAPSISPVYVCPDRIHYGRWMRFALRAAAVDGFTHAVTLDLVRRHPIDDLPALLAAAATSPDAILSAAPAIPTGPFAWFFRAARGHCDFWVWTQCGRFVTDSGQGYRVYPLATVRMIGTSSASRELDVELLVKSAWLKVPINVLPIAHASAPLTVIFTPLQITRYSWRMTVLVLQRMMFADSFLDVLHRRDTNETTGSRLRLAWRQTLQHHAGRPMRFALAIGVGTFFGVLPIWGVQMFSAAGAAHLLGVSKRVTIGACTISSPVSLPILVYGGVLIARALHRSTEKWQSGGTQSVSHYLLGVITVALGAAVIAGVAALATVVAVRRWQVRAAA